MTDADNFNKKKKHLEESRVQAFNFFAKYITHSDPESRLLS